MPSAAEKYILLENQVLVCYWALVETEHLNMGHQVTMQLELFAMCLLHSDPKLISSGGSSRSPSKNRGGTFEIRLKQIPLMWYHPLRRLASLRNQDWKV